jgi:succinate dehydrogenase / fumarate reductase cytochrome b subunit
VSNDNRPLSPHLQVYRLPLTAKLSIIHRITGVSLAFGLVLVPIVLISMILGENAFSFVQGQLSAWYGKAILIGFTLALSYHMCNGVRHLFWDAGKGFNLDTADRSGVAVIIAAILITAGVWSLALLGA